MSLSILSGLKVSVGAEHRRRLAIIDDEDYSGVIRKTREILEVGRQSPVSDQYLKKGVLALKQYYAIALLDPANGHAISAAVDPFWHAHLLHSRQYATFCDKAVGEFMHHIPLDRSNEAQMENIRVLYGYTIEVLNKIFLPSEIDRNFWPPGIMDLHLICWHFGNSVAYPDVQHLRMFEPDPRGQNHAFNI